MQNELCICSVAACREFCSTSLDFLSSFLRKKIKHVRKYHKNSDSSGAIPNALISAHYPLVQPNHPCHHSAPIQLQLQTWKLTPSSDNLYIRKGMQYNTALKYCSADLALVLDSPHGFPCVKDAVKRRNHLHMYMLRLLKCYYQASCCRLWQHA